MANYIHVPPGAPEVPKLDITVREQEGPGCRPGALRLLRRLRPHWRPEEVTLQWCSAGACGAPYSSDDKSYTPTLLACGLVPSHHHQKVEHC